VGLNGFDVVLLAVALGCAAYGLIRGFSRIAIGIASLVVAFLLASWFRDPVAAWLRGMGVKEAAAGLTAYAAIFLLTMLVGGAVAWVVRKVLKAALLSWADRLAGGALGLTAAILAGAFVIHPLAASSPWGRDLLSGSQLAPYASVVSDLANVVTPERYGAAYRDEIGKLRKVWRGEVKPALERAVRAD
jgi:membrane protein required for colicin V production